MYLIEEGMLGKSEGLESSRLRKSVILDQKKQWKGCICKISSQDLLVGNSTTRLLDRDYTFKDVSVSHWVPRLPCIWHEPPRLQGSHKESLSAWFSTDADLKEVFVWYCLFPRHAQIKQDSQEVAEKRKEQWNVFSIRAATQQYDLLLVCIFWKMNTFL